MILLGPAGAAAATAPASVTRAQTLRQHALQRRQERIDRAKALLAARERRKLVRLRLQRVPGVSITVENYTRTLFTLVNDEREEEGLPALKRVRELDIAAQRHAQDMADRDYFSHTTPEGKLFDVRIRAAGYDDLDAETCKCSFSVNFGENIAKGQRTPEEALKSWMNSPPHRANILSAEFNDVGYGYFNDVWVQDFGRILQSDR